MNQKDLKAYAFISRHHTGILAGMWAFSMYCGKFNMLAVGVQDDFGNFVEVETACLP